MNPMQSRSRAGELRRSVVKTSAIALVSAVSLAPGCRTPSGPAEAVSASGAGASGEAKAELATSAPAQNQKAPANALDIIDLGPGRLALRANSPVRVSASAQLERRSESAAFVSVALSGGFRVTEGCDEPEVDCRALRAGEMVAPGAWNGGNCAGACCPSDSAPDGPFPRGAYRFIVSQCDAANMRWLGPVFELPESMNATYRARAVAHVESASVMQLKALDTVDDLAPDANRVAGVAIAAGTEAPLSDAGVGALVRWLAGSGFDDQVVRRCKRANAFGFRLVRRASGLAPEATEIAVDLECNSLGVVHEEGARRLRSDAFFDASRAELIAILKSALPAAVGSSAR